MESTKVIELPDDGNKIAGLTAGKYHRMFNDLNEALALASKTGHDVLAISDMKVYFVEVEE